MGSPVVRAYLNRRVSGDPGVDWLTWALGRIGGRDHSVLVLGCGEGWLERSLAARPEISSIVACDVAEGAVAQAEAAARAAGIGKIRYHVVDLNHEPPPPGPRGRYDLVVAHSVLHHVENLERCYRELAAALAPGGTVLINEYVGPKRFQFTPEQMRVIDRLLGRLPERLRVSAVTGGAYPSKEVPDEAELIATDPSEAVRSDELTRFTRETFAVTAEIDYGGTVLQHLLYDVVQNFDPREAKENRLLALLCFVEEALIGEGALPADYTVVLGKAPGRRGSGAWQKLERGAAVRALRPWELARLGVEGREELGRENGSGVAGRAGAGRGPAEAGEAGTEGGGSPGGGAGAVAAAPRRVLHVRPSRDERVGLDRRPLREAIHVRATGYPDCDPLTWILARERPTGPAAALPPRALVVGEPGAWLAGRLAGEAAIAGVDLLVPALAGAGRGVNSPATHAPWLRHGSEGVPEGRHVSSRGFQPPASKRRRRVPAGEDWDFVQVPLSLPSSSSPYPWAFTNGWLGRAPFQRTLLLSRLADSLAPGGLLVGDDFLGRRDGRPSDAVRFYASELLELLQPETVGPPGRRERWKARLAALRDRWARRRSPDPAGDPAERLADLLGPAFRLRWAKPTGGALLQRVLATGLPALAADDPVDDAFLAVLADFEELLEGAGAIPSDYLVFVAERV